MKKRRIVIAAFLICATLIAGIGYAATTETLTINGTASTTATDINVYFSAAAISTQSSGGGATPGVPGEKVKSVTFTAAGLKTKDDTVTATYTVTNGSDYKVTLAKPNITIADKDNFDVTTSFTQDTIELDAAGGANSSYEFTVTVRLKNTPNTVTGLSSSFTITIGATGK
ncbi:MAG: hypothetical protein IJW38_02480 [Clostridia bacterium]|nr:hypothetical protein [Clostridia bacterium]